MQDTTSTERRLQTAAALLLGAAVLVGVVLRAVSQRSLPPGWWRF